jgi:hypothetical protein
MANSGSGLIDARADHHLFRIFRNEEGSLTTNADEYTEACTLVDQFAAVGDRLVHADRPQNKLLS